MVVKQQYPEQKYEPRNLTVNPLTGIVDTVLDLADTQAYEERKNSMTFTEPILEFSMII